MRYAEELEYLNSQIRKLVKEKSLWRQGEINLEEAQEIFGKRNSSSPTRILRKDDFKFADHILFEIKSSFSELMKDIEALSSIDYPKMLSMNLFHHEHTYN